MLLAYHFSEEGSPFDFCPHRIPYSANPGANTVVLSMAGAGKQKALEIHGDCLEVSLVKLNLLPGEGSPYAASYAKIIELSH